MNGQDVAPRLTLGNGRAVTSGGARFTLLSAYNSISAHGLIVVVRIDAGRNKISLNSFSAVYRSPGGKQRESSDAGGPTDVDAESNAVMYMIFKSVQPGGSVKLDGCIGASCDSSFSVTLRVGAH